MAGVRLVDAAQDFHERRFAGAVLAGQRDDLARMHLQFHCIQRDHAGEPFADLLHFKNGMSHFSLASGFSWERTLPACLECPTPARRMRALPGTTSAFSASLR